MDALYRKLVKLLPRKDLSTEARRAILGQPLQNWDGNFPNSAKSVVFPTTCVRFETGLGKYCSGSVT